jgi:asparagine synthase (glutamine-hydrolysing)
MSALAALFHRDGAPVEASAVRQMLEAERQRGPEAQHVWSGSNVALGHGLLATTPEDDIPQPFCTDDGAIAVVLDGRLDNRAELARALGVKESSASDAGLVAGAYARWGESLVDRLLGDFAFIVWDARRRALVCARDVVGARPLYYAEDGRTCRCASSPWALFAGRSAAPGPCFEAMALFLVERYAEGDRTLFEGVHALAPGAVLVVTAGSVHTTPTSWPAPFRSVLLGTVREYEEQFRDVFREAVRVRMRARGPVAAHVSGGLDSSSVAVQMTELCRAAGEAPPVLVRCVFPGLTCDESAYSQAVADHLGLSIADVTMPGDLEAYRPDAAREPRGSLYNPVSRMLTRMMGLAGEHGARVTLTGAGSDQLLQPTGYELADALRRGDVRAALDLSGLKSEPFALASYRTLMRDGVRRALPARVRRAVRALRGGGDGLPEWLTPEARRAVRLAEEAQAPEARAYPSLSLRRLATLLARGPDYSYSLVLADQIAAASGAELRHPFFDRRVIELLLAFPGEVRAARPPAKALLRRAMAGALPGLVRERTDAAEFSPFVQAALIDAHGDRVAALVRNGRLAEAGLVLPSAVDELVERARRDVSVLRDVVSITSLEVWLRQLRP